MDPKTYAVEVGPKATPGDKEEFCVSCSNDY